MGSNSGIKMGGRKDDTEKEERGTMRKIFAIILVDQLKNRVKNTHFYSSFLAWRIYVHYSSMYVQ